MGYMGLQKLSSRGSIFFAIRYQTPPPPPLYLKIDLFVGADYDLRDGWGVKRVVTLYQRLA